LRAKSSFAYEARRKLREGDERLSGSPKGDPQSAGKGKDARMADAGDKKNRRQRTSDVGRALRSVYDDTLRESVPDDFLNLLGKLS
jgi:hypothetical protein